MRFIFALFALLSFDYALAASPNIIRVRIEQQRSSVTLVGENFRLKAGTSVHLPATSIVIEFVRPGEWKVNSVLYRSIGLDITGENLRLNSNDVPELLHFVASGNVFDVIAELDFEKYLLDVVASEVPSSWPLETLKAQAVAARSYAAYLMNERAGDTFQVDSTTQDQVFNYKRHLKIPNSSTVISAVTSTARQVLTDSNGAVVKAFFHAHCGGEIEEAGAVWPEKYARDPNFKRLKDTESCSTTGAWTTDISKQQILDAFGATELVSFVTKLNKDSARVDYVEVKFVKNGEVKSVTLTSQEFRKTFGYTKVRSTIFTVARFGDTFTLNGRGFGHGVGMCQTGSRWMGAAGATHQQILSRYYAGAKITLVD